MFCRAFSFDICICMSTTCQRRGHDSNSTVCSSVFCCMYSFDMYPCLRKQDMPKQGMAETRHGKQVLFSRGLFRSAKQDIKTRHANKYCFGLWKNKTWKQALFDKQALFCSNKPCFEQNKTCFPVIMSCLSKIQNKPWKQAMTFSKQALFF